jgi:hypothetical protein
VRFELLRPDDLLNLVVETVNLRVDRSDEARPALVVEDRENPARLIVGFPPQTIAESAIFEWTDIPPEPTPGLPPPPPEPKAVSEPIPPPGTPRPDASAVSRLARPSRLVFEVDPDARLPLTHAGLLDWSTLRLAVNPIAAMPPQPTAAQIANAPAIREPRTEETALELPTRLWISPNDAATWTHREAPFTSRGRTELWHTRLVPGAEDGEQPAAAPLRALWSPDYRPGNPPAADDPDPDLGLTAMAPDDRHQIVIHTSAFHGYERDRFLLFEGPGRKRPLFRLRPVPYVPQPFRADLLLLSPLGAWLRSRGEWPVPVRKAPARLLRFDDIPDVFALRRAAPAPAPAPAAPQRPGGPLVPASRASLALSRFALEDEPYTLDLSEWVHVAAQGRDHYVRIVYEGILLPFELEAALVKVTERKVVDANGVADARLFQRMFIVVRRPGRAFPRDPGALYRSIRVTTLVTPNIVKPASLPGTHRSFWVEVTSSGVPVRFPFHVLGTDVAGEEGDFTIPMMFVSVADTDQDANRKAAYGHYNDSTTGPKIDDRNARVPGRKVFFARTETDQPPPTANAQLVVRTLNFVVHPDDGPRLLKADVDVQQVRELLGRDAPTTIRLFPTYVRDGLAATNGVFAEVARVQPGADPFAVMVPAELPVGFDANQAGGFATPDMGVRTFSSALGPLGAPPAAAVADAFDPAAFFASVTATLFGTFPLAKIVVPGQLGADAPTLRTERQGDALVTRLSWNARVDRLEAPIATFRPAGGSRLQVLGTLTRPLGAPAGAEPTFELTGTLDDFEVELLGNIVVRFERFAFAERSGEKPTVAVDLKPDPLGFMGDLEFVEGLRKAIPPGLFGDGPFLDVTGEGIRAGYAFALPPLEVGVFALKDVALGASLTLPFVDGKPAVDFNFSAREQPFQLAVLIFGGGGFFHLQIDAGGMKQLEAALEFGVTASLNLGVASGSVHMMAGIYFSLERDETTNELSATLGGYMRIGGSLKVLAIVTVTVEFNLSFTYVAAKEKAYGRATLTVQVEVLFFSASVSLTVEKAFGGSGDDPTFLDQFTAEETWSEYAEAFA